MPIAMDPDQTVPFVLPGDRAKPAESRPTFSVRFMSVRSFGRFRSLTDEALKEQDNEKSVALILEALGLAIVGWKHIDGDFTIERIPDVLTPRELWELVWGVLEAVTLADHERGKSVSLSPPGGANSAPVAPAGNADPITGGAPPSV